jgi:hypothetical protein
MMPKASLLVGHLHALDRVRGVRVALRSMPCRSLPPTFPFRTFACVQQCVARMRLALCGPHSRPHASPRWRSRLRLRPRGLLARAWARDVSVPSAPETVGARAFPAAPPACRPSRMSLLSGRRVRLPGPNNDGTAVPPLLAVAALPNSRPSPVFSREGGAVGRCPPHARACQVWGLGCRHRRRKAVEIAHDSRVGTRSRFFFRFRGHPASSGPSELDCGPISSRNGGLFLAGPGVPGPKVRRCG